MSSHSHDDHSVSEQKPVSFTVPFIMAAVVILITLMFLSLCDPKPHHAGAHNASGHTATEAGSHDANAVAPDTEEPLAAPTKEH